MMKKIKHFFPILWVFLMSCEDTIVVPRSKLLVSIGSTYALSNTVAEISVLTSQNPLNVNEIGVVWATKSNPTTADNRQSVGGINNVQSYALKLENLTPGAIYYLRAYYVYEGVISYSSDEILFTQNYDPNWSPLPSPTIDPGSYVLSGGGIFYGGNGGITFYAVDKTTNIAKNVYFYPGTDQWEVRYYNSYALQNVQMRFEPFTANFSFSSTKLTLIGGGYTKEPNGNKFYLKDFRFAGISGYVWYPSYPGANVTTTNFGIGQYPYVLENTTKGKLWRFNITRSEWDEVGTVPVAKEAKFVCFDIGDRAFVLPEPDDWNNNLDGFYEYLPNTNQWKPMAAFKGENRRRALSFVYNGKLYYGAGQSTKTLKGLRDIWEYNPTTNTWRPFATYPGTGTVNLVTLMINNILYIGFGQQVVTNENKGEGFTDVGDFWKFTIR
jgi:hypothetical protein